MKKIRFASVMLAGCLSGYSLIAAADSAADAEKFMELLQVKNLPLSIHDRANAAFEELFAQSKAPASKKPVLVEYQKKADDVLNKAGVSWDGIKGQVIPMVTKSFSDDELKQLVDFYQSPVAQKMTRVMPEITQAVMKQVGDKMDKAGPQINDLLMSMQKDLGGAPAAAPKKK